jgi:hypothetical protein
MFAPEPDINRLSQVIRRLDCIESRLHDVEDEQIAEQIDNLHGRVARLESKHDRSDEIEYLVNPYSSDGDPICNYSTNRTYDEEER